MWVINTNNQYLLNPCFMGDNWFIRLDEDFLMLYVKSHAKTVKAVLARMRRIIYRFSIVGSVDKSSLYVSTSSFPPRYSGVVSCWVGRLMLTAPIPAIILCTQEVSVTLRPVGEIHGCD